ncbi:DUF2313 domain-containing protein [Vibrio parahaemolyticus]|uniref:putative phage tail protein n=1 Tax=Vibrio parahaemolyticus TaxID=670 RepID=UPI00226B90EB|nr:putative phage tail protein [Vibrio parahaemolyticus]MCX8816959.1 YmfQ family protein [Vibrio parahaemolyticus]MDF4579387.1 DUF2313 domain-containing protein [Vibrio parahaemolyticus]MDF4668728.1 DUF2313 domain-containing protein [Vibrio parahaemolyticus]HAV1412723.1 DUF2313 domain-containing protein [Vibrio parahaemolyticus]HAV2004805.1 DUF2313 domain-containing protein [Vibrio parahaemolyticus]
MFSSLIIKLLPKGRAWAVPFFGRLKQLIDGIAVEFGRVKERADLIQLDAFPATTTQLSEHEQMHGLTYSSALTEQERIDRVLSRRAGTGGQSDTYFKEVFAKYGFEIGTTYNEQRQDPSTFLTPAVGHTMGDGSTMGGINARMASNNVYLVDNTLTTKSPSTDPDKWTFYFFIHSPDSISKPLAVSNGRKGEFVDLILRYKPVQSVAILFVEFV